MKRLMIPLTLQLEIRAWDNLVFVTQIRYSRTFLWLVSRKVIRQGTGTRKLDTVHTKAMGIPTGLPPGE